MALPPPTEQEAAYARRTHAQMMERRYEALRTLGWLMMVIAIIWFSRMTSWYETTHHWQNLGAFLLLLLGFWLGFCRYRRSEITRRVDEIVSGPRDN